MLTNRIAENGVKARRRLAPAERRDQILAEAIKFFSEFGFDGATRDLADKIGVKQPLIYQYFSSKEELIQEVYRAVCEQRFREEWRVALDDCSLDIKDRIAAFYRQFLSTMFKPAATRILLFSGLARLGPSGELVRFVETQIFTELAGQIRAHFGRPSLKGAPIHKRELEALWLCHGGICFHGIRAEIFPDASGHPDVDAFIESSVDSLLRIYPHEEL